MTYLISEDTLKNDGLIDRNFQSSYLRTCIKLAQEEGLESLIGYPLYTKITELVGSNQIELPDFREYKYLLDEYITPYLTFKTMVEACIGSTFKFKNAGLTKAETEWGSHPDMSDFQYVRSQWEKKAVFYGNRLTDFIRAHKDSYPEWKYKSKGSPAPNPIQYKTGMFLGTGGTWPCGETDYVPDMSRKLSSITVTENGDYVPESPYDGFDVVTVSVPQVIGDKIIDSILINTISEFIYDTPRVKQYTFMGCDSLSYVSITGCSTIGDGAFMECMNLTNVKISDVVSIGARAFNYDRSLKSVDMSNVEIIGSEAFNECDALQGVIYLPKCKTISDSCFTATQQIEGISIPVCSYIGIYAFQYCRNLKSITLPECLRIEKKAFAACKSLSWVSMNACEFIDENVFNKQGDTDPCILKSWYLLTSSVATLAATRLFGDEWDKDYSSAPSDLSIFVPTSLVDEYRTATNWVSLASHIYGID